MSNTQQQPEWSSPMASMFEMQRQSIKQGQQMLQQSMSLQKQAPRVWEDAIESQRSVQKTGIDASRSLAKGMIEMMQASIPSEQPLVGEEETEADERQHEAFESLHQALDDQFEAVEEINEQTWETLEGQLEENTDTFVEFIDQSTSFTEESVNAFVDSLEDVQSDVSDMDFGIESGQDVGTTRMDVDIDEEETA